MSGIEFGKTKEGNTVTKYLLKNKNGMEVAVMDLGATIVSVLCLLYTSPSPRDQRGSRMPSSA